MIPRVNEKNFWTLFINAWWDVGVQAFGDLVSDDTGKQADPEIPEDIASGETAQKFIFGRVDLGDYRNELKNVYGNPVGTTAHVKRAFGKNILTVEDFAGDCPQINILTMSEEPLKINIVRLRTDGGDIESRKVEF